MQSMVIFKKHMSHYSLTDSNFHLQLVFICEIKNFREIILIVYTEKSMTIFWLLHGQ